METDRIGPIAVVIVEFRAVASKVGEKMIEKSRLVPIALRFLIVVCGSIVIVVFAARIVIKLIAPNELEVLDMLVAQHQQGPSQNPPLELTIQLKSHVFRGDEMLPANIVLRNTADRSITIPRKGLLTPDTFDFFVNDSPVYRPPRYAVGVCSKSSDFITLAPDDELVTSVEDLATSVGVRDYAQCQPHKYDSWTPDCKIPVGTYSVYVTWKNLARLPVDKTLANLLGESCYVLSITLPGRAWTGYLQSPETELQIVSP